MRALYIYIVSTDSGRLSVGYTDDIRRDIYARSMQGGAGNSKSHEILVYYETFSESGAALDRYIEVKNLSRIRKLGLIRLVNPGFDDLSTEWQYGRL
jgi:predicted GIY-YIG superfamily endonuclease